MMHAFLCKVCSTVFLEWSVHAVVQWSIPVVTDSSHKMYNLLLYVIHVCMCYGCYNYSHSFAIVNIPLQ